MLQLLFTSIASGQRVRFTPSVDSGCSPLKVKFDDNTPTAGIVSRRWDLDNGNPIVNDSLSVQVNYSTPRTYIIKLVVLFSDGTKDSAAKKVIVHPNPVSDFTADLTTACAATKIHFTDKSTTSTGFINKWTWNLDLSTSTDQNPDQLYSSTGSYRINLIVTNNWGCTNINIKPDYIKIVNKPVINFTLNPKSACTDTLTVFSANNSTDAPDYKWDFGDGNSSSLVAPSHFYAAPGTYTVSLASVIAPGCEDKKTATVTIGKPKAEIITFPDTVCEKAVAVFSGKTSPAGTTGRWVFMDKNATFNNIQASYTFANAGTYDVFFIATNNWNCADTVKKTIYVKPRPVIDITVGPLNTCNDSLTVLFINNAQGAPNFSWDFGDGVKNTGINTSHFYAAPGSYNLTIQDQSTGCGSIHTKVINVGSPHPEIVSSADTTCKNNVVAFIGKTTPPGATARYYFSDKNVTWNGSLANYQFTVPGTFDVFFIADNSWGCTDTVKKRVYVSELPAPAFIVDTTRSCKVPFTLQTTNQTPGKNLEFTWNFGDNSPAVKGVSPSHTYTSFGNFSITLTAKDTSTSAGCTNSVTKTQVIHVVTPTVIINAGPFRNCNAPVDISFTISTLNFIDPPTGYTWDFGDGTFDTTIAAADTHTFTRAGTFNVKVKVTSASGCESSSFLPVTIMNACPPAPDTVIVATYSCDPCNKILLRDTVQNSDVIKWDLGDGTIITGGSINSITHLFATTVATYTVLVERKNKTTGRITTTTLVVNVQCPSPRITSNKIATCINDDIKFIPANLDSSLVKQYIWDFGDGTSQTVINNTRPPYLNGPVTHAYKSVDTFNVTLTIIDSRNCRFVSTSTSIIIQGPLANFSTFPRTSCDSTFTAFFKDSTTLNNGIPIVKWEWNFGDGSSDYTSLLDTLIGRKYKSVTSPVTNYNISLKVTDSYGCTGSITKSRQIILYKPKAAFSSSDLLHCNNYVISFANQSVAQNATYTWYPGDGSVRTGTSLRYTYQKDGMYDVKLVVKDENGCQDSLTKAAYIKLIKPDANIKIKDTSLCWPNPIVLMDSSKYASAYLWNFGDGRSTSTDMNRNYTYDAPGTYTVKLIITGPDGCKDTASQQIRIKGAKGNAFIDSTTGCVPFNATMRVLNRISIKEYTWDFGDGTVVPTGTGDSIIHHTYKTEGKFVPSVIYASPEGCLTYDKTPQVIIDFAKARFSATPAVICESGTVTISDASTTADFSRLTRYSWDFGNGQKSVSNNPPPQTYTKPGSYAIKLSVESMYGCRDTFMLPAAVNVYAQPVVSITGIDSGCQNITAVFRSGIQTNDTISSVRWLLNGVDRGTGNNVSITFNQPGLMDLTLQVKTKHGCDVSISKKILINPVPNPVPDNAPVINVCINSTVQLKASEGTSYSWTPANAVSSPNTATTIAHPSRGTTTYFVTVTNTSGCAARDSIIVKTDDSVFVATRTTEVTCMDKPMLLQATSNATRFLWSPADGLDNPNLLMPRATPKNDTKYQLIGFSNNACPDDTAYVSVKVYPLPSVKASANPAKTIAGTNVMLAATAKGDSLKYRWEPSALVSNATSRLTSWRADNDRTFKITVVDQNGCVASDSVAIEVSCDANTVFVPNAFTPDKSVNNRFRPLSPYKNNPMVDRFEVYNRWGNVVYSVKNVRLSEIAGWDGALEKNSPQDPSGFPWILNMSCSGTPVRKTGTVILVR